jgi:hypothetical protein
MVTVTVLTTPIGPTFSVDGTTYTATQTFSWTSGSSHTIATTSPQSGGTGVQYAWQRWSDNGAISHTVAPTVNTTYTATFGTQYTLTMPHVTGGTVSPPTGWKNSGTVVSISATANAGFSFSNWTGSGTGSYSGPNNPASITMSGPITETATFTQNTTPTPTPTATFTPTPTATPTSTSTPTPTSSPTPTPTATPTQAVLYVASGTGGIAGTLYTIDPATGLVITTVGPLLDAAAHPYGLTGLKYDSTSHILYGVTSGQSPTNPSYLAIVDPATALVTPIGPNGQVLTDIAIDPTTEIMYGISGFNSKFFTINTATGLATQTGNTLIGFANGGGFAADMTGLLFGFNNFTPTQNPGGLYSVNKTTGAATLIGPTNLGNLVKAADFSPSNVFYGLEGGGGIDNTHLRWLDTCNVTTGNCTRLGQINAQDLDALAFIPQ